ncbi:MAG TPA: NUDIX domain-containing protein [Phototrophicaceae bacterium]|jgi:8-oxo-dGTP pyrophosphatase MutT (NUDIX family)|nr:NUDIX domain-containing protein [Phototrophicaceae bacterium]
MVKVITGERIGQQARLTVGCSAIIFDPAREKILLTRRTDNGRWCIPGGGMEAGESLIEACEREAWEETGLRVRVTRLIGVYSTPHRILEYSDGNRKQLVAHSFEAEVLSGELTLNEEVSEFGYFTPEEIVGLDFMEHHRERLEDALKPAGTTFVR